MDTRIPNENPGEIHWKNKLEDADSLSAEALGDKNAAWKKLYGRLRREPRRIVTSWYWVAAACIVPVIIILWLTINRPPLTIVSAASPKIQPATSRVPEVSSSTVEVTNTLPVIQKKRGIPPAMKAASKKVPADQNIPKVEITEGVDIQNDVLQQTPPPVFTDTFVKMRLAEAPKKRRLKVVHINELGDPVEETLTTVRSYERHPFQLKLINQEVYSGVSSSLNNTGFNIFKTKLPSSN